MRLGSSGLGKGRRRKGPRSSPSNMLCYGLEGGVLVMGLLEVRYGAKVEAEGFFAAD